MYLQIRSTLVQSAKTQSRWKWRRGFHTSNVTLAKSIGIVGLPNVGKSCLFNALMGKEVTKSENYPFCTINPSSGNAVYPDERLRSLAKVIRPKKMTPVSFEFVDIAGLVEGASDGKGLGNKFLDNIRGVNAILHVVRICPPQTAADSRVDPIRDINIIENELRLKDIQTLGTIHKLKKGKDFKFDLRAYQRLVDSTLAHLNQGKIAAELKIDPSHPDYEMFNTFQLLSSKPILYLCNVDEGSAGEGNKLSKTVEEYVTSRKLSAVTLSARLEFELTTMDAASKAEFRKEFGITSNGIENLIRASYELLGLNMFYTMGPSEVRGWPVEKGSTARQCAGKIHSDFEQGFVKAEVWRYEDVIQTKGNPKKVIKGADYIMQDGDCFEFKIK